MLEAKYLSREAKIICKAEHLTPRWYERLNADKPATYDGSEYPVLRVWNSRREIVITNYDLSYATTYL
jgi:hypothetical protein